MGYPYISFAGKAAKFVMSTLAMAVIMAASSTIAHGKEAVKSDKGNIMLADAAGGITGKHKRSGNRNLQNLSVSKDFKFYKQVDSLDLADPEQAETLLRFMDIRLAEKKLNEEVILVSDNDPEIINPDKTVATPHREKALASVEKAGIIEKKGDGKPAKEKELKATSGVGSLQKTEGGGDPGKITKPQRVYQNKVDRFSPLKDREKDKRKTLANRKELTTSKHNTEREKENARIARTMERRKAREQARAEEKRKAENKVNAGKRQTEVLSAAEEKAKAEQKKSKEKKLGYAHKVSGKKCPLAEKKKEEAARIAKIQVEQQDGSVPKSVDNILPERSIAYQIASEKSQEIINFDKAITERFKTSGSYLDRGEHGNNIVKDNQGREFLNVMAFWDVLVEPQNNGENYYYGSIQFPLGSRHPAIIKSTIPGDTLAMGCQSNEVLVLKGFETEGVDYHHGLIDAYLAHSVVMPDGTVALQEVVHQPSFSLINVETGCMSRDLFSRNAVDPERAGNDKILHVLPVRE